MISTFSSVIEPLQSVISLAVGGLLVLLVASLFIDHKGSALKPIARYIQVFTTPLFALFVLILIMRVLKVFPA